MKTFWEKAPPGTWLLPGYKDTRKGKDRGWVSYHHMGLNEKGATFEPTTRKGAWEKWGHVESSTSGGREKYCPAHTILPRVSITSSNHCSHWRFLMAHSWSPSYHLASSHFIQCNLPIDFHQTLQTEAVAAEDGPEREKHNLSLIINKKWFSYRDMCLKL